MAPVQIDPVFGSISHRTDLYGLGALLYTLLTGKPPFVASQIPDILAQIVSQPPIPVSQLRPDVTTELESLCMNCLSKDAAQRVGSVSEFVRAACGCNP